MSLRSQRKRKSRIPDGYRVYLQESDYNNHHVTDSQYFFEAMSCADRNKGLSTKCDDLINAKQ